jgi:hypothetical protein
MYRQSFETAMKPSNTAFDLQEWDTTARMNLHLEHWTLTLIKN